MFRRQGGRKFNCRNETHKKTRLYKPAFEDAAQAGYSQPPPRCLRVSSIAYSYGNTVFECASHR